MIIAILFIFAVAVVASTIGAWLRLRAIRHRAVVGTLATIVGQNLPLTRALRAAASSETGSAARIYEGIALRLAVGDSLATALRVTLPNVPGHVLGAIQAGEAGGTLPSVLRSLAADLERSRPSGERERTPTAYILGMMCIIPAVVAFIMVKVVPKFHEIFMDFGVPLPTATLSLINLSRFLSDHVGLTSISVLALVALAVQFGIVRHFLMRVPDRFQFGAAALDALAWHLPVMRSIAETHSLARQMPVLQAGLAAGHDLPAAARQAARVDANYFSRRRLRRWAERIENGGDPVNTARELNFPAAIVSAVGAARSGPSADAAFEFVATYYRNMVFHWQRVISALLTPCIVLFWAACVGYIVVALFLPLTALMDSLADSVY